MAFAGSAEALQSAKNCCLGRLARGLTLSGMEPVLARFEAAVSGLLRLELVDLLSNEAIPVVIVTASPDYAVRFVLKSHPVIVIGTQFERVGEVHTGKILSPPCYGQHKPFWIDDWCKVQDKVRFIEAWSDSPADLPMMMLAERRVWLCSKETIALHKPIETSDYFWPLPGSDAG